MFSQDNCIPVSYFDHQISLYSFFSKRVASSAMTVSNVHLGRGCNEMSCKVIFFGELLPQQNKLEQAHPDAADAVYPNRTSLGPPGSFYPAIH